MQMYPILKVIYAKLYKLTLNYYIFYRQYVSPGACSRGWQGCVVLQRARSFIVDTVQFVIICRGETRSNGDYASSQRALIYIASQAASFGGLRFLFGCDRRRYYTCIGCNPSELINIRKVSATASDATGCQSATHSLQY